MKKVSAYVFAAIAAGSLLITACGDSANAKSSDTVAAAPAASTAPITKDSTFEQKAAYSVGASVGTYIASMQKEQGKYIGDLDHSVVIKGFVDALNGKTDLTENEITQTLVQLDTKVRDALDKQHAEEAKKNLEDGQNFLKENAKKEGIKTTKSGLQYEMITEGTGKTPTADDIVEVKYKGTTIDGKVFDEQKEPIKFPLNSIIPGWTEGLQLMKEGGKAKFFIPSDLAYGEMGAGDVIPPNSTLIFDIELVKVLPKGGDAADAKGAAADAKAAPADAKTDAKAK